MPSEFGETLQKSELINKSIELIDYARTLNDSQISTDLLRYYQLNA